MSGGVGGELECRGEPDALERDEVQPSPEALLDMDEVEGRDRVGS